MKVLLLANYPGDCQPSMERFCRMLSSGLNAEGIEVEVVRPGVILGRFFKSAPLNKWLRYIDKFLLFRSRLRRARATCNPSVVHILDQGNAMWAGWLRRPTSPTCPTSPTVITCHNLLAIRAALGEIPAHRPAWTGRFFQRLILRGLRSARALACASTATQRDAARLIGKSTLIANGLEDFWRPVESAPSAPFMLHVGGDQWYKNRPGVVRAFITLREKTVHTLKLVMAGPDLDRALAAELNQAGLKEEVTVLNDIPDNELRALYSSARLLIFPSIEEGFGWPILEAQACGCPVVTTDKEPMRATGGSAAVYAREGEWAVAAARVLGMDAAARTALIAAGRENARQYTTAGMAREYIAFYRGAL